MNRRTFIQYSAAGLGAQMIPLKNAMAADPATVSLIIAIVPSMVQAIFGFFSARMTNELHEKSLALQAMSLRDQKMLALAKGVGEWMSFGVSSNRISYNAATSAYSGLVNSMISGNYDGNGSVLAVRDGLMYAERAGENGTLHAGYANTAKYNYQQEGVMPVPVTSAYALDKRQQSRAVKSLADTLSMSDTEFSKNYVIESGRDFSRARYPAAMKKDLTMYAVYNRQQIADGVVNAKILQTPA